MTNDKTFDSIWQNRGQQIMADRGVPKRFLTADKSDFTKYPDLTIEEGYFITGSCGTGKTRLLASIVKEMFRNDIPSYFISTTTWIESKKKMFDKDNNLDFMLDKLLTVDVLCLDDIGSERITDFVKNEIFYVIDYRYSEMKKTFITSNMSLGQIAENYDDRLASRIAEMCKVFKMNGEDRRVG